MNYLLEVNDDTAVATSNGERWGFSFHHSKRTQKNTHNIKSPPQDKWVSQMNPTSAKTRRFLNLVSEHVPKRKGVCLPF